jgi:hypothetical protein
MKDEGQRQVPKQGRKGEECWATECGRLSHPRVTIKRVAQRIDKKLGENPIQACVKKGQQHDAQDQGRRTARDPGIDGCENPELGLADQAKQDEPQDSHPQGEASELSKRVSDPGKTKEGDPHAEPEGLAECFLRGLAVDAGQKGGEGKPSQN